MNNVHFFSLNIYSMLALRMSWFLVSEEFLGDYKSATEKPCLEDPAAR